MAESENAAHKPKRERSPNYPGIDLGEALERATKLYDMEGKNAAPLSTVLQHWGYKPQSGAGLVAVAALKKFGLIDDEGKGDRRRTRLSDLALRIIRDDRPDSRERVEAIQEAALTPPIHRELWSEFKGSLPSDENLRYTLKMYKGFTDLGAKEFVRQFRSTIAIAKLPESDMLSGDEEDKEEDESEGLMTPPATLQDAPPPPSVTNRGSRVYQIPISAGESAALQITYPLTTKGWAQMMKVLEAMKPGLIESGGGETAPNGEGKEASE